MIYKYAKFNIPAVTLTKDFCQVPCPVNYSYFVIREWNDRRLDTLRRTKQSNQIRNKSFTRLGWGGGGGK